MYIEQAIKGTNPFYKYILGIFIIALAFGVGQVPLTVYVGYLITNEGYPVPANESEIIQMMDSTLFVFLMMLSFVVVFVQFPLLIRALHKMKFVEMITSRKTIDYKRLLFSFSIWGGFLVVSTLLLYVIFPDDFEVQFDVQKFLLLSVVAVVMIPIQSATEEFIFRGYLMQGLGLLVKNRLFPLIMTSVLFGLMHGMNPEVDKMGSEIMLFYIGTGLMLGVVTLMDEGMELALGFHIANNLITVLLVTTDWGALQTNSVFKDVSEPDFFISILFPLIVAYPILLIIFARKYQWSHWTEKLTGTIKNDIANE